VGVLAFEQGPQRDVWDCEAGSNIADEQVAPFGLSIVVPAKAGPFNLGNVVERAAISVNPYTAAVTITSSALTQIKDGVPVRLRTLNVTVDRPSFLFNPTNCVQQQITGALTGSQGTVETVSSPFAATR
jgi:hypothetical protein